VKKIQSSIPPKHLSKRIQRIICIVMLYITFFNDNTKANYNKPITPEEVADMLGVNSFDPVKIYNDFDQIISNLTIIDKHISEFSSKRSIAEFDKISLNILRYATWESVIAKITPPKVAISEAVEISKYTVSDNNTKLINAIINKIHENYSTTTQ